MNIIQSFYDHLATQYDKLFLDWQSTTREQAVILENLFKDHGFDRSARILDCACGIGTQSIGLAALGYSVTASDISEGALGEAKARAAEHPVEIRFDRVLYMTREEAAKDPSQQKACYTGLPDGDILSLASQIDALKKEVERLKTFEENQVAFQQIKEKFYEEVVYAENGPGADEYRKYYEEMDPTTAEALYKQVIQTEAVNKKMKDYVSTFSNMQASEAASILGSMTDNLDLAAEILKNLDSSTRGAIMGAMDPAVAARITKIMDPNS